LSIKRLQKYEYQFNTEILPKIPLLIKIDAKNFSQLSKDIEKPFCIKTMKLFTDTTLNLVRKIPGVYFAYQYSDKIFLALRNDQSNDSEPWMKNDIQKISSYVSSYTTNKFLFNFWNMTDRPDIDNEIIFDCNVFGVPNITELINYLVFRQFKCYHYSINNAIMHYASKKYKEEVSKYLENKGIDERKNLLKSEFGINFENYPEFYRLGMSFYKIPLLIEVNEGKYSSKEWFLDIHTKIFDDNKDFLGYILNNGVDRFRPERDSKKS